MSDTETRTVKPAPDKETRPLMFVVFAAILFSVAAFLINDRLRVHTVIAPTPELYKYDVSQNVGNTIHYAQTSFYNERPGPTDTAYIADLTKSISSTFSYRLRATEATDLSYRYEANAVIRSTFGSKDGEGGMSNVWSKQFRLLDPVIGSVHTNMLSLNPVVEIPYAEYRNEIGQFVTAFNVPLNSEMQVTYKIEVSGESGGTPFKDSQTSTITAPLDQQVYRLGVQFSKANHQEVVPAKTIRLRDTITRYEMSVAIILIGLGVAFTAYGFRRQIIKSPYQRELEKIYRYHDGIIVRASRPTNFANKNVVVVQSFDDLLNIEEEIKTPIVASQVSDVTTHFFITRDDVIYVFTLGVATPFKPPVATGGASGATAQPAKRPVPKRKVMG